MLQYAKNKLASLLERCDKQVVPFPLAKYLADFKVDCVLDVGANIGQYGKLLRKIGYGGRICSFEPQSRAYEELLKCSGADSQWGTFNFALGAKEEELELNISEMSPSSSFSKLLPQAVSALPALAYVGKEQVRVKRLDDVFAATVGASQSIFMKIDVQGFEKDVLDGAMSSLEQISGIQIEVSLTPQYADDLLLESQLSFLRSLKFEPYWLIPGHKNCETLQLLQVDLILFRTARIRSATDQEEVTA